FEDDDLDEVARNMADIKLRRLPVLNGKKRLVGIISIADIALAEGPDPAGQALCGISEPGGEHSQSMDGKGAIAYGRKDRSRMDAKIKTPLQLGRAGAGSVVPPVTHKKLRFINMLGFCLTGGAGSGINRTNHEHRRVKPAYFG